MAKQKERKMLNPFTTLFLIIIVVAILTWIIPAGQYAVNDAGEFIPGTYEAIEQHRQGLWDIFSAPFKGMIGTEGTDGAIEVGLFIFVIGGFLGVVTETGAIDAGIGALMRRGKDNANALIWGLMLVFGLGGSTYGMAEETIAFYPLLIPIMVGLGMDSIVAVAVVLVGSGIGVLASTVNPFATAIASQMAGISMADGMLLRVIFFIVLYIIGAYYVSSYGKKVRENDQNSYIAGQLEEQRRQYNVDEDIPPLNSKQKLVLIIFVLTFVVMIISLIPWGDLFGGETIFDKFHEGLMNIPVLGDIIGASAIPFGTWYLGEITMLFFASSVLIGIVYGINESRFVDVFLAGMGDMLSVAMICAIARGIQVVMNDGMITATILHWGEQALAGLSQGIFTVLVYLFYIPMSFLIPSTSGLAAATMGIMGPLGQFAGVGADIVVTAYQAGAGIVNLITPTSGVVMGALAIGGFGLDTWLKFMKKLLVIIFVVSIVLLLIGTYVL